MKIIDQAMHKVASAFGGERNSNLSCSLQGCSLGVAILIGSPDDRIILLAADLQSGL